MAALLAGILGLITATLTRKHTLSRRLIPQLIVGFASAATVALLTGHLFLQFYPLISTLSTGQRFPPLDALTVPLTVTAIYLPPTCTEGGYSVQLWFAWLNLGRYSIACEPLPIMLSYILGAFVGTLFWLNLLPALVFALIPLYFIPHNPQPI